MSQIELFLKYKIEILKAHLTSGGIETDYVTEYPSIHTARITIIYVFVVFVL